MQFAIAAVLISALCIHAEEPAASSLSRGTLLAPQAFRAAAAKVQPSLVRIEGFGGVAAGADGGGFQVPGEGPTTGLVLSSDGYIITSTFNFLRKPPIITVVMPSGRRHVAKLLGRDETRKLCLLKVDGVSDLPVPELVPREKLQVGQWAVAIGVGFGASQPALSAGILSATSRISGKAVQTDANTSPANYGGPLVDLDGRVIGICVPLSPESKDEAGGAEWYDSGIGFAVPLDGLDSVLTALKEGKTLKHAFLGVQAQPAGDPPAGAVVKQVVPDSPAAKAGLQAEDKILSIGGSEILDVTHLASVIGRYVAGDKVEVLILRGEKRQTLTAELAVPPPPPPPMPGPMPPAGKDAPKGKDQPKIPEKKADPAPPEKPAAPPQ